MKENNETCTYGAPLVAYRDKLDTAWNLYQTCCNHWDCPRCGIERAKQEYGRIVSGLELLHNEHGKIYFVTLTCKGRDMPLAEAEENYMLWTNRLLTNLRKHAKKRNVFWSYVQVTERQGRGHPHSHILTTYYPDDIYVRDRVLKYSKKEQKMVLTDVLGSDKLQKQIVKAGLGNVYDISVADSVRATSRYVAKYLFKDSMKTRFPKSWRRVRYSRNFPKLPKAESEIDYFPLLRASDWQEFGNIAITIIANDNATIRADIEYYLLRNGWDGLLKFKSALHPDDSGIT